MPVVVSAEAHDDRTSHTPGQEVRFRLELGFLAFLAISFDTRSFLLHRTVPRLVLTLHSHQQIQSAHKVTNQWPFLLFIVTFDNPPRKRLHRGNIHPKRVSRRRLLIITPWLPRSTRPRQPPTSPGRTRSTVLINMRRCPRCCSGFTAASGPPLTARRLHLLRSYYAAAHADILPIVAWNTLNKFDNISHECVAPKRAGLLINKIFKHDNAMFLFSKALSVASTRSRNFHTSA